MRTPHALQTELAAVPDGILVAPVAGYGTWGALRQLHESMAGLRRDGLAPELTFVYAIAGDGRIVPGRHPEARIFVLGYRFPDRVTA